MLYIIHCTDKADSLDLRLANRPAHVDYLKSAGDRIKLAGPLHASADDDRMTGSVIILDAASQQAVELFVKNDPYHLAGLFETVTVHPYTAALGSWKPDA